MMQIFRLKSFILVVSLILGFSGFASLSWATDISQSVRETAIEIAQTVEAGTLVYSGQDEGSIESILELPPRERLLALRRAVIGTFSLDNDLDLQTVAKIYSREAQAHGTIYDKDLAKILDRVAPHINLSNIADTIDEAHKQLFEFTTHEDWFARHHAWLFLSVLHSHNLERSLALEYALNALAEIPDEVSIEAKSALIQSTYHIAYLHNLLNQPEKAVENTAKLIELQLEINEPIRGISLLNNLMISFLAWRDFETAQILGETLLRLEAKTVPMIPGLVHMRMVELYNESGRYEEALPYIDKGIEQTDHPYIVSNLWLQLAMSRAGIQEIEKAEAALQHYHDNTPEETKNSGILPSYLLKIKSLLALAKGDLTAAEAYHREFVDESVTYVLKSNNQETAQMLARLQNSKERIEEREAALQREAALKQLALEKQIMINRLLVLLASAFGLAAFVALIIAHFRSINAARLENAAILAQAGERAKAEFLAVMSHELRTPLNGIMGMSDHLIRSAPTEDLREKAGIIHQSGEDLLELIENVLDMSLLEGGDIELYGEPVSVRKVVRDQCEKWEKRVNPDTVTFTAYVHDSVPEKVELDKRRFLQCLNCLLSNAIKFTLKGRVHLHITATRLEGSDQVRLNIIVADTGVGISDQDKENLFNSFVQADSSTTRQFGGAGLGLSITRSLAYLMGGELSVVSRLGRGSEFTLTVAGQEIMAAPKALPQTVSEVQLALPETPRLPEATAPQDMPAMEEKLSSKDTSDDKTDADKVEEIFDFIANKADALIGSDEQEWSNTTLEVETSALIETKPSLPIDEDYHDYKILVVDDDINTHHVFRSLLEARNYTVSCAEDGSAALNMMDIAHFDVVLTDLRMPGVNGIKLAEAIRSSTRPYKNIPIIAITADAIPETKHLCLSSGIDIFMTKPIKIKDLYASLDAVLKPADIPAPEASQTKKITA